MAPKRSAAKKKHPAPKRPKSAYIEFAVSRRPELVHESPGLTFGEIGRRMGQEWRSMSDAQKKLYQDRADKGKATYHATKARSGSK